MSRQPKLIGFDADDTLWCNCRYFKEAERRVEDLMRPYLSHEDYHRRVERTEYDNMPTYGYGVMAYTLSLLELAIRESQGQIPSGQLMQVIDAGKWILRHEVELKPGAREALQALSPHYRLVLISKGDLLDQKNKLQRSGLAAYFHDVEIVTEKAAIDYRTILAKLGVEAQDFLMVGNSYKSDIAPVLELGGQAVHVPDPVSWSFELIDSPDGSFHEVDSLHELPDLIASL